MKRTALLALLVLLLCSASAWAQHTVTGTVTSDTGGAPLPGVNVVLLGTGIGTATDAEGEYALTLPSDDGVLVFSFLGYEQQEIEIDGRSEIDVVMAEATQLLDDLVVIGYGEMSRRKLASATSSIRVADLAEIPVAGVDAAIQGKTAGVQVIQNSGTPGGGISVRVRGHSSISADNQPLYVIDGVPMLSEDYTQFGYGGQDVTAVTNISPSDIESIDVLKDAAAIAIYGSRGANGVVQITTRRGRAGRPRITFDSYVGSQSVVKELDLLNGREYVEFMNEAALNDNPDRENAFGDPDTINVDTDWQGEAFRQAPVQSYDLAISGGDANTRYYVSGSYYDQEGIVIGSKYDRVNLRANLDLTASERLSLSSSIALSRESNSRIENDNTVRGVLTNAIANQPHIPAYNADGTFTGIDDGLAYVNGIAVGTLNQGEGLTYRALGSLKGEYLLLPGFRLNARLGADVLSLRESQYRSPRVGGDYAESVGGIAQSAYNLATRYVTDGFLTYDRIYRNRHDVNLTGGASVEVNDLEWNYLRGINLGNDYFENVANATELEGWDGSLSENNLVSFFARANYIFADRYILSASFRADGSSRFAPNKKWGYFPAVAVAWRATEEPFLRPYAGADRVLSDLKLRASYGVTGNQSIGNYTWQDVWGSTTYGDEPGLTPSASLANLSLGWESTTQTNVGLDLSLFGGRIGLVADYYYKLTTDLIWSRRLPYTSGGSTIVSNIGEVENKGFELLLNTINFQPSTRDGFRWETSFNLSRNVNEVLELYENQRITTGRRSSSLIEAGQPIGAFYMFRFAGVDPETGNALYEDFEQVGEDPNTGRPITEATGGTCFGPGTVDIDEEDRCGDEDRQVVGSPHPDFVGGFTNRVSFKGFDLNVFVLFSVGNEIFHASREYTDDGGNSLDNKLDSVTDRWQQPGDITDTPRASLAGFSGASNISDRFLEDGSFVRLKTVTLGYSLPGQYTRRIGMQSARLYVSAQNLLTLTKFTGLDPEVNYAGSGDNAILGTEFYTFPQARTFLLGLQVRL